MNNFTGFTEADSVSDFVVSHRNQSASLQENWNYEATVKKVEVIMARIEAGELELDQIFDEFSEAVKYLHQCELFLAQRRQQMDLLIETLTDDPNF